MSTNLSLDLDTCGAWFDPTERYRYKLLRRWAQGPTVLWVMLNPSTADATVDDPTVRRCILFTQRWAGTGEHPRYGGLVVANLFALRSTDPRELKRVDDPVGLENDRYIIEAVRDSEMVIAAWGVHGRLHDRDRDVLGLLREHRKPVRCLGVTKGGDPRHPLYMPNSSTPVPYAGR